MKKFKTVAPFLGIFHLTVLMVFVLIAFTGCNETEEDNFVTVTGITGVPAVAEVNIPLTLTATVSPSNATSQTIVWSVKDAGTTGATLSAGNTLTATAAGTATVTATIAGGISRNAPFTKDFSITVNDDFVAVSDISDVPAEAEVDAPLTLAATVTPSDATNQTIVWSIKDAGTTGASISEGNILTATAAGEAIITATIANGASRNAPFTKDFSIMVEEEALYALIHKDSEMGEGLGEWDAVLFGADGMSYWFMFDGELNDKFAVWNVKDREILMGVKFDDEGLPKEVTAGDFTFVFANFTGKMFDVAVFLGDSLSHIERSIETDIDWDVYKVETMKLSTRALSPRQQCEAMFLTIDILQCALSLAAIPATGGLAAVPVILNCGNMLLKIAELVWDEFNVPTEVALTLDCASGSADCVIGIVSEIYPDIVEYMDQRPNIEFDELFMIADITVITQSTDYYSAALEAKINMYPDWYRISSLQNEFGIFYSKDPQLPAANRTRMSVLSLDIPQSLTITDLDPGTTYYYCTYIVYDGNISYGQLQMFTTKSQTVTLTSPEQGSKAEKDKWVDVTFFCYGPDFEEIPGGVTVNFSTNNGSVDNEKYHTNENGTVTVRWTPGGAGATLTARILGKEGNVISEAVFVPEIEEFNIVGTWSHEEYYAYVRWDWWNEITEFLCWGVGTLNFYADGTFVHLAFFPCVNYNSTLSGTYIFNESFITFNYITGDLAPKTSTFAITFLSANEFHFTGGLYGTAKAKRISTSSSPDLKNKIEQIQSVPNRSSNPDALYDNRMRMIE